MKHTHYECIVAWAEGKQVQIYRDGGWFDCEPHTNFSVFPNFSLNCRYRIKPDINKTVQPVGVAGYDGKVMWEDSKNPPVGTILYALKSAEVLANEIRCCR